MEVPKLLARLTAKDFYLGISMGGAHAGRGGLFYKAAGVTPLFGAGASQDPNNGLLMAGPAGTVVSGSLTGTPINMIPDNGVNYTGGLGFMVSTDDSKVWKCALSGGVPSGSLGSILTAGHTLTPGLVTFAMSGANYLFYKQIDQIGRYTSTGPTQIDNYVGSGGTVNVALNTDYFGAMHVHYGLNKIIFGNGLGKLGTLDGSASANSSALTFDASSWCTALSDDGQYVVAAISRNTQADSSILSDTRIIYWDGTATTGFIKDYPITDPYIYALKKTPIGVFAFGLSGIWQVTLDGVKKVFSHSPGVYTNPGNNVIHYGPGSVSFFNDAVLWGGQVGSSTSRALKSFGKLDSVAPNAYLQPTLLTASKNITVVNGQISKGYVFVGDSTPQLMYYPVGSGTPQTGVSAQMDYLELEGPADITHIDMTFGEPLASGDTVDLDVFKDEDNTATDFSSVSYNATKTIRSYQFKNASGGNLAVDAQYSPIITFTAGTPKIKTVEIWGYPKNRQNV